MRLKRETQGAFCVLNANPKSQTRKSMKINVICTVVDRCRVWESHADPAVRRMSKPTPDPMYPAYAVGDTDSDNEVTRVAAVTGLK